MADVQPAGVFVLGMHRAGTSALAGVIATLGVPVGDESELKPASPANPQGFWEVEPLVRFNEELLGALGGSWSSPPELSDGWHADSRLDPYRERGRELFARMHPTAQWVWKDPRNSVLLPFWASLVEADPVLVISHRNPLEVQRSLAERNGLSKLLALALWERYLRAALRAAEGYPVMVVRYSALLDDPARTCGRVADFLGGHGVDCDRQVEGRLGEFLRDDLRHSRVEDSDAEHDPDLSRPQGRLMSALSELEGEHSALPAVDLPPETPATEVLLDARRDAVLALARARERFHLALARARERFQTELHAASLREDALRQKLADTHDRNRRLREKLALVRKRTELESQVEARRRAERRDRLEEAAPQEGQAVPEDGQAP
jgi:hypothetical protein